MRALDVPDFNTRMHFWDGVRIVPETSCWLWTRGIHGRNSSMYGRIAIHRVAMLAHRVAYRCSHSDWDDSLGVLHTCDNPVCCNPAHLYQGTPADNATDRTARGRSGVFYEEHGPHRKLSSAQVEQIRREFKPHVHLGLAKKYGITHGHLRRIVKGLAWQQSYAKRFDELSEDEGR